MKNGIRTTISLGLIALAFILRAVPAAAICGCTGMTIHTVATPQTLCSDHDLDFPECAKSPSHGAAPCAAFTHKYLCPVGSTTCSPKIQSHYGFVAESQIAGGSTLADCEKGQALQLTITSNQAVDKPKIGYAHPSGTLTIGGATFFIAAGNGVKVYPDVGTNDPVGNPFYGSDNYSDHASASHLIQWSSPTLKWWDNTDQEKDDAAEQARWQYRFLAFVKGSPGKSSCACIFDVDVDWRTSNANTPTVNLGGPVAGSTNCVVQ